MAKGFKKIKIKVEAVTLNGAKCSCPEIKVLNIGKCIDPNCAYDEKTKTIIGEVNEQCLTDSNGNGDACITYHVKCKEGDCVDAVVTKCLCNDKGDCGDCEDCINGICEKLCPEEQCYNGECRDCNDDTACECNKVCLNGRCVCAVGQFEKDGCCVECDEDNPCPDCFDCVNGQCIAKDCGTGVCNPEDDTCVDCVRKEDCLKDNECCKDNTCECCTGYTRDTCTGECVRIPLNSCQSDGDCGGCTSCTEFDPCTGYGICTPVD